MTLLTNRDKELIEIVQEQTLTFSEACYALELDPSSDLVGCDFSFVDFTGSNISGFNFSRADLTGAIGDRITGVEEAVFNGAKLSNSVFNRKQFLLPDDFYKRFYESDEHFSTRVKSIFATVYDMDLSTPDNMELVIAISRDFYREPLILCSAISLIDSDWKNYPPRFDIIDRLITHEFPSVCIEALKALERFATLEEIAKRYSATLFGSDWRAVRYACFLSSEEEMNAEFKAGKPKTGDDWLDPVEKIQEDKEQEAGPYIYSQKVFEQGQLPSQSGYLTDEGGQVFSRIARRSNILYKFDTSVSGISAKKYYSRVNLFPTVDLYKRLFFMPHCFNLLNLSSPKIFLEKRLSVEFTKNNKVIVSKDGQRFERFEYLPSN